MLRPVQCSLSTVFLADGIAGSGILATPDIMLCSTDSVIFYVHSTLLAQSRIGDTIMTLTELESLDAIIPVTETAEVLNILLHTIYSMPCAHFLPSFPNLERAVEVFAISSYDLLRIYTEPSAPFGQALLAQASSHAMKLYTLAAFYHLHSLAIASSSFLLSFDLSQLSEDVSQRMGSVYLKKLFFLHLGRREALKRIVMTLPEPHIGCKDNTKRMHGLWMKGIATLAWEKNTSSFLCSPLVLCLLGLKLLQSIADLSPSVLELTFKVEGQALQCAGCRNRWDSRVCAMLSEWGAVKASQSHIPMSSQLDFLFSAPSIDTRLGSLQLDFCFHLSSGILFSFFILSGPFLNTRSVYLCYRHVLTRNTRCICYQLIGSFTYYLSHHYY